MHFAQTRWKNVKDIKVHKQKNPEHHRNCPRLEHYEVHKIPCLHQGNPCRCVASCIPIPLGLFPPLEAIRPSHSVISLIFFSSTFPHLFPLLLCRSSFHVTRSKFRVPSFCSLSSTETQRVKRGTLLAFSFSFPFCSDMKTEREEAWNSTKLCLQ